MKQGESTYGSVSLRQQINGPDGRWTGAVAGWIEILPADVTGMPPARGDTPWCAAVHGERSTVYIPGCMVALVAAGNFDGPDVFLVP